MGRLSTSGLSAGGFVAAQFHVAFSSQVNGCGVFAGGPYYCAQDSETTALSQCMSTPFLLSVDKLVDLTKSFESSGDIDSLSNLDNQNVYLYSGTADTVVNPKVVKDLEEMYQKLGSVNITSEYSIDSEHCLPTLDYGSSCTSLGSPYINKCDYDGAGEALQAIYGGKLNSPVDQVSSNIVTLPQQNYVPPGKSSTGLESKAYAYVPTSCQKDSNGTCDIHVVWHGCTQSYTKIGDDYYVHGGYNGWAEANNIIVLYPQCAADLLKNPEGCFDWWGYTGSDYAFKTSSQMGTAMNMVASFFNSNMTKFFDD